MTDDLRRDLRELPPPSLGVPENFYEQVMATARRRRRARWTGSAAVAVGVAVASVVIGVSASGGTSTARLVPIAPASSAPPTAPPSAAPPTAAASSPAVGPGFVPLSVSFVTPQLGWAYGPDQPEVSQGPGPFTGSVAVTYDGGEHWSPLPAPRVGYSASGGATSVFFLHSDHGYLYGDGLFETNDGGITWRKLTAPGPVSQLVALGQTLYVTAMTCPASQPLCGIYALYTSDLDGTHFTRVDIGTYGKAYLSAAGPRVILFGTPAGSTDPVGPYRATVSEFADGRQQWSSFSTPCEASGADFGAVAPFGDHGLALVCGSSASAGIQGKTAYVSTDSGAHWTMRGSPSSLPEAGYVGVLAAADESTWVLAEQRGGLMVTHDGGNSWHEGGTVGRLAQGTDGWGQVVFTDPRHSVAVPNDFYSDGILISSDSGDNWSVINFTP